MSRRSMVDLGVGEVHRLLYETGSSRSEISELTGETVAAINTWASRGRIPKDVVETLKQLSGERTETRRIRTDNGELLDVEMVEMTPDRLEELSESGVAVNSLKGRQASLSDIEVEVLVGELERRGWDVSLSLKK